MPDAHDTLFAPPGAAWRPISSRWRSIKRVSAPLSWLIVFAIPTVAVWLITADWRWAAPFGVAGVAIATWRCVAMGALWRSWGYAELADDLWVSRGWSSRCTRTRSTRTRGSCWRRRTIERTRLNLGSYGLESTRLKY